jgi:hypothetical protein
MDSRFVKKVYRSDTVRSLSEAENVLSDQTDGGSGAADQA